MDTIFEYDVAISFASEQRTEAEAIAQCLRSAGVSVFYDAYEEAALWGKNLYDHLATVYQHQARYCLMLVSAAYAAKVWTTHERQSAQARALTEKTEYILPVRYDDTPIPGLLPTMQSWRSWRASPSRSVSGCQNGSRPAWIEPVLRAGTSEGPSSLWIALKSWIFMGWV
ncbi:MAG: TIR domain-containing protein [Acidobacteriia bacterium]|nr:TIR domain-containing protein [Terriglobia bacterium]